MHLLTKSSFFTAATFTVAMLAALACGKTKPTEEPLSETTTTSSTVRVTASCDNIRTSNTCSEFSSSSASFGVERSLCRGSQGDFATTKACPTTSRIGSCELSDNEVKRYYAGGEHGHTAESARIDCEQNGASPGRGRFVATR